MDVDELGNRTVGDLPAQIFEGVGLFEGVALIAGMRIIRARLPMVPPGQTTTACRASFAPDRGKMIPVLFDPPTAITTMRRCDIRRTACALHIRSSGEEIL